MILGIRLSYASLILFLLISGINNSYGQKHKYKNRYNSDCERIYGAIKNQYDSGHYYLMEQAFSKLGNTCKGDSDNYRNILEIMYNYSLQEGRTKEANEYKESIDRLKRTVYISNDYNDKNEFPLNVGILTGWNFLKSRKPAATSGIIFTTGFRIGIRSGVLLQKVPFYINITRNLDNNNRYKPDGFSLKTTGSMSLYTIPVLFAIPFGFKDNNIAENYYNDNWITTKLGFLVGVSIDKLFSSYINDYYYEYDYAYGVNPASNSEYLTFKTKSSSDYMDKKFFKTKTFVNAVIGLNFRFNTSLRSVITILPQYSFGFSNLKPQNINNIARSNIGSVNIILSYRVIGTFASIYCF